MKDQFDLDGFIKTICHHIIVEADHITCRRVGFYQFVMSN